MMKEIKKFGNVCIQIALNLFFFHVVPLNCYPKFFLLKFLQPCMVVLTESICWKVVAKRFDSSGIGLVIYEKPVSSSCYESRKVNNLLVCDEDAHAKTSW